MTDELRRALDDLVHGTAAEQESRARTGGGLPVARMTARARRGRIRHTALVSATATALTIAVVVGGVAAATWDRPEPAPAGPPTHTTSPVPRPDPTPSATSSPAPDAAPPPSATPTAGVVRPHPAAPTTAWSTTSRDLWGPDAGGSDAPEVGDASMRPHVGFESAVRVLQADDVLLVALHHRDEDRLVGVDAATGAPLWRLPEDAASMCAGVHDGMFVCLGGSGTGGSSVQLLDRRTGAVTRVVGPGGDAIAVAEGAAVVARADGGDVQVTSLDLATGAERGRTVLRGAVDPDTPPEGVVVRSVAAGPVVRVDATTYAFALDVRTGAVLGEGLSPVGVRPDGWANGWRDSGTPNALVVSAGPGGAVVELPGRGSAEPSVWVPDPGVQVPLLTGDDIQDGLEDEVRAIDPATGSVLWSVPGVSEAWPGVVGGSALLIGGDLVAVDLADGHERWRAAGSPVGFDGDHLLVDAADGLRALDPGTGSVAWVLPHGSRSQVWAAGDDLVLHDLDGGFALLRP